MQKERAMREIERDLARAIYELKAIYPEFDPTDTHNVDTPKRIAKMWIEMFRGLNPMDFKFTTFPNDVEGGSYWIIKKDIEFSSMCQHHFMPFMGKVNIGYVPKKTICGISKLDRVVEYFSKRPQVQERLGSDIMHFLEKELQPEKLVITIESLHTCVACRGIESRNSTMITTHSFLPSWVREFKELIR